MPYVQALDRDQAPFGQGARRAGGSTSRYCTSSRRASFKSREDRRWETQHKIAASWSLVRAHNHDRIAAALGKIGAAECRFVVWPSWNSAGLNVAIRQIKLGGISPRSYPGGPYSPLILRLLRMAHARANEQPSLRSWTTRRDCVAAIERPPSSPRRTFRGW